MNYSKTTVGIGWDRSPKDSVEGGPVAVTGGGGAAQSRTRSAQVGVSQFLH
jgi:hypothetical protein